MRLLKPQVSTALGWSSLVALVVLALFGLWGAPPDKVQSDAQRLMYLHVPTAWIAYLAFGVTALASALWLWKRTRATVWDRVAGASAEIGVLFTALLDRRYRLLALEEQREEREVEQAIAERIGAPGAPSTPPTPPTPPVEVGASG
jgi:hypothetical protein